MSRTTASGDGWITGIQHAPPDASITAMLAAVRESPLMETPGYGVSAIA